MLTQTVNGFSYDPTTDNALHVATEYAANSTLQSLAGSGVLNSSATAERVSRIVSELIPTYEEKAHDRWSEYLGNLADTAQIVMNYDSQQFEYWKDAKDREFQEKEFEYQKQQDELDNAWKRVDELGYVDNNSSAILGVKVGTLSKDAREAKEEREFELQKMREEAEIEFENNKALYKLKAELDKEQSEIDFNHDKELQKLKASLEAKQSETNFNYDKELQKLKANLEAKQSATDFTYNKQLAAYKSELSKSETENEYKLSQKYTSNSSSSKEKTSLSTYKDIIESRWGTKDSFTGNVSVSSKNNDSIWNYIRAENEAGRMSDNTAYALIDKYNLINPNDVSVSMQGNVLYVKKGAKTYTINITKNATRQQILNIGSSIGVDLSKYV